MNAALYAMPSAPRRGQNGRLRKKGKRIAGPEKMAALAKGWRKTTVRLYGKDVCVHYKSRVALWYNSTGTAPVRIVVVRDFKGRRKDDAFFSTDPDMSVETILETYAQR